jgi:hypothetical protein
LKFEDQQDFSTRIESLNRINYTSAWLYFDLRSYRPVFPRPPASDRLAGLIYVYGTGLEVSPGRFFKNGIIRW